MIFSREAQRKFCDFQGYIEFLKNWRYSGGILRIFGAPPGNGGGALGESRGSIWSWILIIDIMEIRFFDLKYSKNFARNTRYIPCIFKVLKITKSLIFWGSKKCKLIIWRKINCKFLMFWANIQLRRIWTIF